MDEKDRVAIAVLEANARNTDANLIRLEGKVDSGFAELKADMRRLDTKIDGVKDSVSSLALSVEKGFSKLSHQMMWLYIGLGVSLLAILARALKWI